MSEKNNNDEVLTFEELRKKLGMDESNQSGDNSKIDFDSLKSEAKHEKNYVSPAGDDITAQIEKVLEKNYKENEETVKTVTENGKTFVDITSQYVKKADERAESSNQITEPKVKKVRTFNEIFSDFFKGLIPLKKDSTKEKVRKIIMDISIIVIIGCAVAFGELFRQYRAQLKTEGNLKGQIIDTDDFDQNQYNEAWEEIFAQYPNIKIPEGMNLKYAYLYAINQDLVGWLKIDNTNLDVQVVQKEDNDYYLRRDFYGKSSRYGCPYMDYRDDSRYLDDNTIIYGHHMPDGLMFSNLDKYKTLEGYKDSPIIRFDTLYGTYYFKVFAAFISNAEVNEDNGYLFNYTITKFSTDEKFNSFIENVKQRSIFNSGVTVQPDDKLITLVTCSYEFNEARLVVMGRMVRENEDMAVDTSIATLNTSPRYPQAWYDAKGTANPYADAEKWTP